MTAEAEAVHSIVWGNPDVLLDEYEAGRVLAAHFVDPVHRAVVDAVLDLLADGSARSPAAIHHHLVGAGWRPIAAADAVLMPGIYEPWTGQGWRLPLYLDEVAEEHERRRLRERIVALADQLDRPGGAARVATALGVAS